MAVTWGAVGTGASGTTSCTPSYPTGISAATSKLFCVVTGRSNTAGTAPTMPAGWTSVLDFEGGTGTWGVDTGTRRVTIFQKDTVDGTESGTVTVSLAGTTANTLRATIHRIEVTSGYSVNLAASTGADTTNGTGYSATGSSNIDFAVDDLLLIAVAQNIDTGTQSAQSITASGITFGTRTNRASTAVTNGNDHRHIIDTVPVSSGSGSVAPTYAYTISASGSGPTGFLRIREVQPAPSFSVQPSNQTVELGGTAIFSATVSGATSLQWQVRDPSAGTVGSVDFGRVGSDDYSFRTDAPNHNSAYSVLLWMKIDVDANDYQHMLHIGGSNNYDGNTDFIGTDTDGTTMRVGCAGGSTNSFDASGMGSFTVGTAYWLAMVRESATSLKFYKGTNASDLTLVKTLTDNVSARTAASRIQFGGYNSANLNGKIAKPRVWNGVALTLSELQDELQSLEPIITTGLWSSPAFDGANLTEAGADSSGNGRNFSFNGTDITISTDGPPEPFVDWTNAPYGTGGTTDTWSFTATADMEGREHRLVATNAGGTTNSDTATIDVTPVAPVITGTLVVSSPTYAGYTISGWSAAGSEVPVNDWQYRINGGSWVSLGSSATNAVITGRTHGAYDDVEVSAIDSNSDRSNILSLNDIHVGFETISVSALDFPANSLGNSNSRIVLGGDYRTAFTAIWKSLRGSQTDYYAECWLTDDNSTFDGGNYTAGFHPYPSDGTFDSTGQRLVFDSNDHYFEMAGLRPGSGVSRDYIASPESIVGAGNQVSYPVDKAGTTWYTNVVTIELIGGTTIRHKYYVDFENDPTKVIIQDLALSNIVAVSTPAWIFGSPPWMGTGNTSNETPFGKHRYFKLFTAALSESDALAEAQSQSDAPETTAGIASALYSNINPTVTDITDKSGEGNNPSWGTSARPSNWSGTVEVEIQNEVVSHDATGALSNAGAAISGSASSATTRSASGVLSGGGGDINGTAARTRVHPSSGVLANSGATLSGTANRTRVHPSSGVLANAGGSLAGSASSATTRSASGVLAGAGGVLAGSAERIAPGGTHDSTGTLQGAGGDLDGSANRFRAFASSGVLSGAGGQVVGSAQRTAAPVTHDASGDLEGAGARLVGFAINETAAVIDTHDGFWAREYRKMWERKPKVAEVVELVKEEPIEALEVVRQEVEQKFDLPDNRAELSQFILQSVQLQRFIAKRLIEVAEQRRIEQDEEDAEILLLM